METFSGLTDTLRPRVLIIEDDTGVRRSLLLLMHARGLDAKAFAEARLLIADAALHPPDCLVAHHRHDESGGIAVLRSLRDFGWAGPAVLLYAIGYTDAAQAALQAGFAAVFEKPLRQDALVEMVSRLARGQGVS